MSELLYIKDKLKNSNEAKTVFANFSYLSLLQIAGYVFPLITLPYLARVIGAEGFGKLAFASAVVVWFQTISDWGFNLTATRNVAQNRDDKERVSRIFSNVLWARFLLTIFSGLLLTFAVVLIPYLRENAAVLFITFLVIPGYILFPDWFFQAIEKMKYTTIFNLFLKFLFTVAVFFFIRKKEDYLIQPLLAAIGYFICGIGALYLILKRWGYTIYRPNMKDISMTIKDSADVFINNIMPNLYNSFSVMLLGFWGGSVANGVYDGGNKLPTVFIQFQSVLSRAFYPFLSRRPDKHDFFVKLNIGTALMGALFFVMMAPWIVELILGSEFENSVVVMQILSFSIVFYAMSNTYGTNYLIVLHKERPLRTLTFISSLIGMCVSIPLVYYFTYIGAAITVLLCRGMLGIGSLILAKKVRKAI